MWSRQAKQNTSVVLCRFNAILTHVRERGSGWRSCGVDGGWLCRLGLQRRTAGLSVDLASLGKLSSSIKQANFKERRRLKTPVSELETSWIADENVREEMKALTTLH